MTILSILGNLYNKLKIPTLIKMYQDGTRFALIVRVILITCVLGLTQCSEGTISIESVRTVTGYLLDISEAVDEMVDQ